MQESLFFLAEQLFFCIFIPWGLSMIIQAKLWIKLVKFLYSRDTETFNLICLISGVVYLPFAVFLILTHNDWEWSPSVIVTVLGWMMFIKCFVLILCPQLALKCKNLYNKDESFLKWYLRGCGTIYILLGLLVASNFWVY